MNSEYKLEIRDIVGIVETWHLTHIELIRLREYLKTEQIEKGK